MEIITAEPRWCDSICREEKGILCLGTLCAHRNVLNTSICKVSCKLACTFLVLTYLELLSLPVSMLFLFPKFFKHKIDQLSDFRGALQCIKYIHHVKHPSPWSASRTLSYPKRKPCPLEAVSQSSFPSPISPWQRRTFFLSLWMYLLQMLEWMESSSTWPFVSGFFT